MLLICWWWSRGPNFLNWNIALKNILTPQSIRVLISTLFLYNTHQWNWLEGTQFRNKAGNRKYLAIHPSRPLSSTLSQNWASLVDMADFPYSPVWLHLTSSLLILSGCPASVDSALSSPLHITGCTLWLLSRDLITRAPGGRAPPMDRRVADSGSSGLSDTASYTARPAFALSLSRWSPAGRRRGTGS